MYELKVLKLLLISSFFVQEDIERFDPLDENMETLLSNDGGDGKGSYGTIKQSPAEHQKASTKGKT